MAKKKLLRGTGINKRKERQREAWKENFKEYAIKRAKRKGIHLPEEEKEVV